MLWQAVLSPAQNAAFLAALNQKGSGKKRGENGDNITPFHSKNRTLGVGQHSISTLSRSRSTPVFISKEDVLATPMLPSSMLVCRKECKIPGAGGREGTGTCAGFSPAPSW